MCVVSSHRDRACCGAVLLLCTSSPSLCRARLARKPCPGSMPSGVLRVHGIQAFHLPACDKAGAGDRYVRFTLDAGGSKGPVSACTKKALKVRWIAEPPLRMKYPIILWENDEVSLEVPDGFMQGKLCVSIWHDSANDDGSSVKGAMGSVTMDVDCNGAILEPLAMDGFDNVQISFNYAVILDDPPPPAPPRPPVQFIATPRGKNVVPPNEKSLKMALELARRVAGDSQKELTVLELLQRGANVLETPRNVPRLASLGDAERERIVEANKKVLRETILALHIVATDADEHLTTLLSRQLFVRAIAARVPEGQLLQSMKKDQFKYGGVHSMAAAR